MAKGITRATDRVAIWLEAAEESPQEKIHGLFEAEIPPSGVKPSPTPTSLPEHQPSTSGTAQPVQITKSKKFLVPAHNLKKVLDKIPAEQAQNLEPHSHGGLGGWMVNHPDFVKSYLKPHYQDQLKVVLGQDNYDKLLYHMPKEHHTALTTHAQLPAPKSNKYLVPTNSLKKLLDHPDTTPAHVKAWLDKHPAYLQSYLHNPSYQDALKAHLGPDTYDEWAEDLDLPITKPIAPIKSPAQSEIPAAPPAPPAHPTSLEELSPEGMAPTTYQQVGPHHNQYTNPALLKKNQPKPPEDLTPQQKNDLYDDLVKETQPEPADQGYGDEAYTAPPPGFMAYVNSFGDHEDPSAYQHGWDIMPPGVKADWAKAEAQQQSTPTPTPADQPDIDAIKAQMPAPKPPDEFFDALVGNEHGFDQIMADYYKALSPQQWQQKVQGFTASPPEPTSAWADVMDALQAPQPPAVALQPGQEGMLDAWMKEHPQTQPPIPQQGAEAQKQALIQGIQKIFPNSTIATNPAEYSTPEIKAQLEGWLTHLDPDLFASHHPELQKLYDQFFGKGAQQATQGQEQPTLAQAFDAAFPNAGGLAGTTPEQQLQAFMGSYHAYKDDPKFGPALQALYDQYVGSEQTGKSVHSPEGIGDASVSPGEGQAPATEQTFGQQLEALNAEHGSGFFAPNWDDLYQSDPAGAQKALVNSITTYQNKNKPEMVAALQAIYDQHFGGSEQSSKSVHSPEGIGGHPVSPGGSQGPATFGAADPNKVPGGWSASFNKDFPENPDTGMIMGAAAYLQSQGIPNAEAMNQLPYSAHAEDNSPTVLKHYLAWEKLSPAEKQKFADMEAAVGGEAQATEPTSGVKPTWTPGGPVPTQEQLLAWGVEPDTASWYGGPDPSGDFWASYKNVKGVLDDLGPETFTDPNHYPPSHPWNKIFTGMGVLRPPAAANPFQTVQQYLIDKHGWKDGSLWMNQLKDAYGAGGVEGMKTWLKDKLHWGGDSHQAELQGALDFLQGQPAVGGGQAQVLEPESTAVVKPTAFPGGTDFAQEYKDATDWSDADLDAMNHGGVKFKDMTSDQAKEAVQWALNSYGSASKKAKLQALYDKYWGTPAGGEAWKDPGFQHWMAQQYDLYDTGIQNIVDNYPATGPGSIQSYLNEYQQSQGQPAAHPAWAEEAARYGPAFDWATFAPEFKKVFPKSEWAGGTGPGSEDPAAKIQSALETSLSNPEWANSPKTEQIKALYNKWFPQQYAQFIKQWSQAHPPPEPPFDTTGLLTALQKIDPQVYATPKGQDYLSKALAQPKDWQKKNLAMFIAAGEAGDYTPEETAAYKQLFAQYFPGEDPAQVAEIAAIEAEMGKPVPPPPSKPFKSQPLNPQDLSHWASHKPQTDAQWKNFTTWWGDTQLTPQQEQGLYQSWFSKPTTPEGANAWFAQIFEHNAIPSEGDLGMTGVPGWAHNAWAFGTNADQEFPLFQQWAINEPGLKGTSIKQKVLIWNGLSAAEKAEIQANYAPTTPIDTQGVLSALKAAYPDSNWAAWAKMPPGTLAKSVGTLAESGYDKAIPIFNQFFGGNIPLPEPAKPGEKPKAKKPTAPKIPVSKLPAWVKKNISGTPTEQAQQFAEYLHYATAIGDEHNAWHGYPSDETVTPDSWDQWVQFSKETKAAVLATPTLPFHDLAGFSQWKQGLPTLEKEVNALYTPEEQYDIPYGLSSNAKNQLGALGELINKATDPAKKSALVGLLMKYHGAGTTSLAEDLHTIYPGEDWDKLLKTKTKAQVTSLLKKRLKTEPDPEKWIALVNTWAKHMPNPSKPGYVAPTGITALTEWLKNRPVGQSLNAGWLKSIKHWKDQGATDSYISSAPYDYDAGPYVSHLETHPDTPGLPFYVWTPPIAEGENFTYVPDPALLGAEQTKKTYTIPATQEESSKEYHNLLARANSYAPGFFSGDDKKLLGSEQFANWFNGASKDYRMSREDNPGMALDEYADFMAGGPLYPTVPAQGHGGWEKFYDTSPFANVPLPSTKAVNGQPFPSTQTHNTPRKHDLKFPRFQDPQETLPMGPGEHWAPHYAPVPIYRIIPNDVLNLDGEPKLAPTTSSTQVSGAEREHMLQLQRWRLRRIDQILNGVNASRSRASDVALFDKWCKDNHFDPVQKQHLADELFSVQPTTDADEKWKYFEQTAKDMGVSASSFYDLASKLGVGNPGQGIPKSRGSYDDPEVGQLILDYVEGASGLGYHWTRDRDKLYTGIGAVGGHDNVGGRQIPVFLSGHWSGQGEGQGEGQAFEPNATSELEHNLKQGAPVWIYRVQIKDQNQDYHDVMDYGPMSQWPPGRNETAKSYEVLDRPSLASRLEKDLGGTFSRDEWDILTPGPTAEAKFAKLYQKLYEAHGKKLKSFAADPKKKLLDKIWRDFFVGRPELKLKPQERRAAVERTSDPADLYRLAAENDIPHPERYGYAPLDYLEERIEKLAMPMLYHHTDPDRAEAIRRERKFHAPHPDSTTYDGYTYFSDLPDNHGFGSGYGPARVDVDVPEADFPHVFQKDPYDRPGLELMPDEHHYRARSDQIKPEWIKQANSPEADERLNLYHHLGDAARQDVITNGLAHTPGDQFFGKRLAANPTPPRLEDYWTPPDTGGRYTYEYDKGPPPGETGVHEWRVFPSDAPAVDTYNDEWGTPHTLYYDPARVTPRHGRFSHEWDQVPNQWIADLKPPPGLLWRGLSHEEWENAKQRGYFESNGSYNLGDEQKGLTLFTTGPEHAQSYASSFAPWQHKPTFTRPAHIIGIPERPHDWEFGGHEVGLRGRIPFTDVQAHYVGHPYAIEPGGVSVDLGYGPPTLGSAGSGSVYAQWEPGEVPTPPKQPTGLHPVAVRKRHGILSVREQLT